MPPQARAFMLTSVKNSLGLQSKHFTLLISILFITFVNVISGGPVDYQHSPLRDSNRFSRHKRDFSSSGSPSASQKLSDINDSFLNSMRKEAPYFTSAINSSQSIMDGLPAPCPNLVDIHDRNGFFEGRNPHVVFQSKLLEGYHHGTDSINQFSSYRVVVTASSNLRSSDSTVPLFNLPIQFFHNDTSRTLFIQLDEASRPRLELKAMQTFNVTTSAEGRLVFSVILSKEQANQSLLTPIIYMQAPFMPQKSAVAIPVDVDLLHSLSNITGSQLRSLSSQNEHPGLLSNASEKLSNAVAAVIRLFSLPLLNSRVLPVRSKTDRDKRLKKRDHWRLYQKHPSIGLRHRYHAESNLVMGHIVENIEQPHSRFIHMEEDSLIPLEIQFSADQLAIVPHDSKSLLLRHLELLKRDLPVPNENMDQLHQSASPSPPVPLLHRDLQQNDTYYNRLNGFATSWIGEVGKAWKASLNLLYDSTIGVVKSAFNFKAMFEGGNAYLSGVEVAVSNATKDAFFLAQAVVNTLPLGGMANRDLGIDELMHELSNSSVVLITPVTFGLELIIHGPSYAFHTLVHSTTQFIAVLEGILKKFGIFVNSLKSYFTTLFHWDDILLNHRILISHNMKMVNFIKVDISSRNTTILNQVQQVMAVIDSSAANATLALIKGNVSDVLSILTNTNSQIISNATNYQSVSQVADYSSLPSKKGDAASSGYSTPLSSPPLSSNPSSPLLNSSAPSLSGSLPMNVQSKYVHDHYVSNMQNVTANVSGSDMGNSFMSIVEQCITSLLDIGEATLQQLGAEAVLFFKTLAANPSNLNLVFAAIGRLMQFNVEILATRLLETLLTLLNSLVTLLDSVMSFKMPIPFLNGLYQHLTGENLTFFNFAALYSVIPATIYYKAQHSNANFFTADEAAIMIESQPEKYVDELVLHGMQTKNANVSVIRPLYRSIVSYIIGSGYAAGQLLSAVASFGDGVASYLPSGLINIFPSAGSFISHVSPILQPPLFYVLRAPFEFISILCNFPWSFYTESITPVGLNVRFVAWITQFVPFFTSWPSEFQVEFKSFPILRFFGLLGSIPPLIMVFRVWLQDVMLVTGKLGAELDGATLIDVTIKGIARTVMHLPQFVDVVTFVFEWPQMALTLKSIVLIGAALHTVRLAIDIPSKAIYSV